MLIELAKQKNAWYIDTSLEQYQNFLHIPVDKITKYNQFKKNNLYHQNLEAFRVASSSKKTRIVSGGMNPGLINEYTKKALRMYCESKGYDFNNNAVWKGDYAKLAHDYGLKEIQIVEYDTQKLKVKATPDTFVNTWSSCGFQEEASDLVMLSLNNDDLEDLTKAGYNLIKPIEKGSETTHIRFIAEHGMNMERESICLDDKGKPFKYVGRLIPHAEVISMSQFFTYKGDAPTIMYVYRPCDEALRSLEYFKQNNYELLPNEVVVRGKDIKAGGYDSIGSLLTFKNGERFGGWTICSIEDTRRLDLLSNPTTLQVVAFLLPAIKWALENPNESINNADDVPHKYIFKHGEKYMGKSIFKFISF